MIQDETKTHKLKDGNEIIIRKAASDDASQYLQFFHDNLTSSLFIPLYPDELVQSVEEEKQWINSFAKQKNCLLLMAESHGKIIGNISVNGHSRSMLQHTASIGMSVINEWRNKGIGKLLMQSVINWSEENEMLELLWLQVFAQNIAAITLYKKMGFIETGRQKNFFKSRTGFYSDNITMTKYLLK